MNDHLANLTRQLKKGDVLTVEKDKNNDLYYIFSGKLMVCIRNGTQVTPLAYVGKNEFIGELSFFDGLPRSADIVALEDCSLIQIPSANMKKQFPQWLIVVAKYMTKRMRLMDDVIRKKGVKKKNTQSIQPLSIEEQRYFYEKIKNFSPK